MLHIELHEITRLSNIVVVPACAYTCICVYVCACACLLLRACVCVWIYVFVCVYVCVCIVLNIMLASFIVCVFCVFWTFCIGSIFHLLCLLCFLNFLYLYLWAHQIIGPCGINKVFRIWIWIWSHDDKSTSELEETQFFVYKCLTLRQK